MLSEIKKRYAHSLARSESFLNSKKTTAKSTSITQARELCLLRNQAECPICATKFIGKNHNTEHIHPRALGGLNNDENKIQMCTACNHSRNLTMQSMLGNPPYYKNYQKIKADVDEFILWSEVTADDGLQAGSVFLRPQEIFIQARFASNKPSIPQRTYGRFSTWDKGSPPNLEFNNSNVTVSPIGHSQGKRKIGLIERFFDTLFGYKPTKSIDKGKNVHIQKASNPSKELLGNDEFVEVIRNLLSHDEEKSFEKLAPEFLEKMQNKGYNVNSVNQCLELFGFPKGLRKAVDATMNEILEYDGTITSPTIKLIKPIKNVETKNDQAITLEEESTQLRLRNEFIEVVNKKLGGVDRLHINNLFSPWTSTTWHDSGFNGWKEFKIAMGYTHSRSLTSIVEELVGDRVSIIHEGTTVYISFKEV